MEPEIVDIDDDSFVAHFSDGLKCTSFRIDDEVLVLTEMDGQISAYIDTCSEDDDA